MIGGTELSKLTTLCSLLPMSLQARVYYCLANGASWTSGGGGLTQTDGRTDTGASVTSQEADVHLKRKAKGWLCSFIGMSNALQKHEARLRACEAGCEGDGDEMEREGGWMLHCIHCTADARHHRPSRVTLMACGGGKGGKGIEDTCRRRNDGLRKRRIPYTVRVERQAEDDVTLIRFQALASRRLPVEARCRLALESSECLVVSLVLLSWDLVDLVELFKALLDDPYDSLEIVFGDDKRWCQADAVGVGTMSG